MRRRVHKTMEHDELPHWARKPIFILHGNYLKTKRPIINNIRILECFKDNVSELAKTIKMWRKELFKTNEATAQQNEGGGEVVNEGDNAVVNAE